MRNEFIRVGTRKFVNESSLDELDALDLLLSGFHEFVYIPDYSPYLRVNGTWTGVFGHIMNDTQMDSIESKCQW